MIESVYASQVSIACFIALVLVAAVSDIVSYKIPNVVVLTILILYPIFVLVSPVEVEWLYSLGIFALTIVIGIVLAAMKVFGAGDMKLLAAILLWAGPPLALPAVIISTLIGGVLSVLMLTRVRFILASLLSSLGADSLGNVVLARNMPYGVALAAGGIFIGWALLMGL